MGLDSYFKVKKYEDITFSEDINLCGGMFSGNGYDGSFRGKVYAQLIEAASNISIYEEELNHNAVCEISAGLNNFDFDTWNATGANTWEIPKQQFEDLKKLFSEAAAIEDTVLLGWW